MNESEVLRTILENIQTKVSPHTFAAYFTDLQILSVDNHIVTIACKNAYTKQSIENRFFNTLLNTVREVLGSNRLEIQLVIKSVSTNEPKKMDFSNLFANTPQKTSKSPSDYSSKTSSSLNQGFFQIPNSQSPQQKKNSFESYLNPKYTFENLVVGSHNQLAHAAAIAISNNPGNAYNPFFIYGDVGLGKTHLMQAIGHSIVQGKIDAKVLYCTTETFLNEMVESIRTQKGSAFREKYRALDALILDDIQFLSNKQGLQEEFFNTFNALYQSGKQIIIASDRPPGEISHLEDRIRSRFEGGLVTDIKSPNLETRIAILQKKVIERNEFLPEVILGIDTNIRELEGALLKVSIHYQTTSSLSPNDVKTILGAKILSRKKKINPLDIMNIVCEEMQIPLKDVKSSKRNYDIAMARQICMFLLKDILNLQLIKIAKHVGRRDHTTVMHGISKIEKLLEQDEDTARIVNELKFKIQQ
jgi:chromosomal replication initiator protein